MAHTIQNFDPKDYIVIRGATTHNLKNIDIAIPKKTLVVFTGLSGSGKTTLVFDTIYAEGQRRYIESLSTYARQFLGKIQKPEFESIAGLTPAIAVKQQKISHNKRSTVGTLTEVYNYVKVLYARVGKVISPFSGKEVRKHTVADILHFLKGHPLGVRFQLVVEKQVKGGAQALETLLKTLHESGYHRIFWKGENHSIHRLLVEDMVETETLDLVIDRLVVSDDFDFESRCFDSISLALSEGEGRCKVLVFEDKKRTPDVYQFSTFFEEDGCEFLEPSPHLFSFNAPYARCPNCEGSGVAEKLSERLVIPNPDLSVSQDAVAPWRGLQSSVYKRSLMDATTVSGFPCDTPYKDLTEEHKRMLWEGCDHFDGIRDYFDALHMRKSKGGFMQRLRFKEVGVCVSCGGMRLRKEALYIQVAGKSISDVVVGMTLGELSHFFDQIVLSDHDRLVAERPLIEIKKRLECLIHLGLYYLNLGRAANTLSGGEIQRISLANCLGNNLRGVTYVLDEPSIGLHSWDTRGLVKVLKQLRDMGNTVLVVEHDEDIIRAADQIVDMGPKSGHLAGEILYQGALKDVEGVTLDYLYGRKIVHVDKESRTFEAQEFIHFSDVYFRNLKGVSVRFPARAMTVVTGVSGSGKSTLVHEVIYPTLARRFGLMIEPSIEFNIQGGGLSEVDHVEFVGQDSITKNPRSIPITYIKAYDDIRTLFSEQALAKAQEMGAGHFSYNTPLGRCATCKGDGEICEEMQFMPDVRYTCEDCGGKRFGEDVLLVTFEGKNIFDILSLTVNEAVTFFTDHDQKDIARKIVPLKEVGLGYLRMNQSVSQLSGGELQRVKLAAFIAKGSSLVPTLFIFDEPTVGLHFEDVQVLLEVFRSLIKYRHTLLIVEHNLNLVKNADWVIDLGPLAGNEGGEVIFQGTVSELSSHETSYTGRCLNLEGSPFEA